MELRAVTLHLPTMKFLEDNTPTPKTHTVGASGCKSIEMIDGGVLVHGEDGTGKAKSFWTPFTNVVWAEQVAKDGNPIPAKQPTVQSPAPPPISSEKKGKR